MTTAVNTTLAIGSPAFIHNGFIPSKYSCHGANVNPELIIGDLPQNTASMALIIDDPDAPGGTYDHWIMWNIPPTDKIEENSAPGMQGKNSQMESNYTGPCPPSGTHHYHFKVFALDSQLYISQGSDKRTLMKAMEGHIIASGELIGLFKK